MIVYIIEIVTHAQESLIRVCCVLEESAVDDSLAGVLCIEMRRLVGISKVESTTVYDKCAAARSLRILGTRPPAL